MMSDLNTIAGTEESPSAVRDNGLVPLTLLMGWGSLLIFMIFMAKGSLNIVNLRLGETQVLLLNTILSLAFFVQHSGMIRETFRGWMGQFIEEKYLGVLYTIVSGIILILVVLFWQQSNFTLASAQGWFRWVLRGLFCVSILGFYWGIRSLSRFDAFGIGAIRSRVKRDTTAPSRLLVRGPYRWVRHPLYFFVILMIWSCPDLTLDRLLFNVLWTVWIVVGTVLEERDLVALFGDDYRNYQEQVPMLFPTGVRPTSL